MAWIMMRTDLRTDVDVLRIAVRLDSDPDLIVGKLHRFWSWADSNTDDGVIEGLCCDTIDRIVVGMEGFCAALIESGWLEELDGALVVPNFEAYMSKSAKRRATEQRKKSRQRAQQTNDESDGDTCPDDVPINAGHCRDRNGDQSKSRVKKSESRVTLPQEKNNISLQRDVIRKLMRKHFEAITSEPWAKYREEFISFGGQKPDTYPDGDHKDLATGVIAHCIEQGLSNAKMEQIFARARKKEASGVFGYLVNALTKECNGKIQAASRS